MPNKGLTCPDSLSLSRGPGPLLYLLTTHAAINIWTSRGSLILLFVELHADSTISPRILEELHIENGIVFLAYRRFYRVQTYSWDQTLHPSTAYVSGKDPQAARCFTYCIEHCQKLRVSYAAQRATSASIFIQARHSICGTRSPSRRPSSRSIKRQG